MARLIQIVAVKTDGKCPVAVSDFLPESDLASAAAELLEHGYGARQETHPNLEGRDQGGRVVELPRPAPKKKAAPKADSSSGD